MAAFELPEDLFDGVCQSAVPGGLGKRVGLGEERLRVALLP
jgi:hypothetical protein